VNPPATNETYLYRFTIHNELGNPVESCYIEVKKQINASNFSVISNGFTDANGYYYIWLNHGQPYIVYLNKTGYEDQYNTFIPSNLVFEQVYIMKIFEIEVQPPIVAGEDIHFTAEITNANTTIIVNYTDDSGYTEWTSLDVSVFNYSTFLWQHIGTYYNASLQTWEKTFNGVNHSNDYYFNLTYHNTYLGSVHMQLVFEAYKNTSITPPEVEDKFDWLGVVPFGITNFLMWLFFVAVCYYADERDSGKIIIAFGVICIFLTSYIGFISANSLMLGGGIGLSVLFIILGFLMEKGGRK